MVGTVTLDQTGVRRLFPCAAEEHRVTARVLNGDVSADQPLIQVLSVASMSAKRVGTRAYSFTGRVYPTHAGCLVMIYRNDVLAARGRCDASGIYTITTTFGAGTFSFQARTASDTYNVGTTSTARSVRIYERHLLHGGPPVRAVGPCRATAEAAHPGGEDWINERPAHG